MAEPAPSPATAKPPARPRRGRRRYGRWGIVVLALVLAGQGLGWFGGGGDDEGGDPGVDDGDGAVAVEPDDAARARSGDGVTGAGGHTATAGAGPAAGSGEGAAAPGGAAPVGEGAPLADGAAAVKPSTNAADADGSGAGHTPGAAPTPDDVPADRFASLSSLLEQLLGDGELGQAAAAAARLRAQPLSSAQRARVDAFGERLDAAREEAEARVVELLRRGEVLAADRAAGQLLEGEVLTVSAVQAAGDGLDLPDDLARPLGDDAAGPATLPAPAPLARQRRVRLWWQDELRTGEVASSRTDRVTVRLRTDRGQTYPTVATTACEPTDATVAEAIEMGLAAVHAQAPRLARLWLVRAWLASGGALGDRGERLRELLR